MRRNQFDQGDILTFKDFMDPSIVRFTGGQYGFPNIFEMVTLTLFGHKLDMQ
jgi:hypothetical protein